MQKVSIVGGGASGIFLALLLSREDFEVRVFEKDDRPLKKLMATGNGRCNFTNQNLSLDFYRGEDKKLLAQVLKDFDNEDARRFFRDLGMLDTSLESGRVYPYTMAGITVNNLLLNNLGSQVELLSEREIVSIEKTKKGYSLKDNLGQVHSSDIVVLATGGLRTIRKNDYSKGHDLAKSLGHKKTELFPGIVQLRLEEAEEAKRMKNLKFNSKVSLYAGGKLIEAYEGDTLFADYGLSGLAILQLSNEVLYRLKKEEVILSLDLLPQLEEEDLRVFLEEKRQTDLTLLASLEGLVQEKIAIEVVKRAAINPFIRARSLRDEEIKNLARTLKAFNFKPLGPKSKDDGQITCGGLILDQLTGNLESKIHKNLYFTGEILDVQGDSGGYNLQWAWSSAHRVYKALTGGKHV